VGALTLDALDVDALPAGALLLVDSAPIIYTLEANERFAARFAPLFQRHADGELALAVSTVTIAEVLTGPLKAGEEALAKRYRAALESWQVVDLTADIAESAARLRGQYGLKLPDAIQLASALAINADALVSHDRDFSKVRGVAVLA
jgi:predicted nucleic acid-binding protein